MTQLTPAPSWIVERPIAHRGFHDLNLGRAENSLSAFRAAVDAGFSIECDLQNTATGTPVVFHDPVLGRMTGVDANVRNKTPRELAQLHLLDTHDCINTLDTHLAVTNGNVPLVLELKGIGKEDDGFVEGVADCLKHYRGPVCVMSFDHSICRRFAKLMPYVARGLVAKGGDKFFHNHMSAMSEYDLQFVSYRVREIDNKFVRTMRAQGLPVICWTVRDEVTQKLSLAHADQMTFEGFDPRELPNG